MKISRFLIKALLSVSLMIPAAGMAQIDISRIIQGGTKAVQAMTLSDNDILQYVQQYVAQSDKENKVLGADSPYGQRLARLTEGLTQVDGMPLNFKVYDTDEVNAFACADGSVRVYSGLMDIMTDNEVLGVIGHEIGHVAHHDTRRAFKQALLNSALLDGLASTSSKVALLTDSQLGAIGQALAKSKYSKKQETEADDYGYDFLKSNGKNPIAMEQAFVKLQQMEAASGAQASFVNNLFSDHPDINKRIENMKKRCIKDGYMDANGNAIPTAAELAAQQAAAKAAQPKAQKTATKKTATKKKTTSTRKTATKKTATKK